MHRIIQEALTNVARHAGAAITSLRIDHAADHVEVHIDNEGGTAPNILLESTGVGIIGMRERAESLGGTLTAEPTAGGGFHVTAVLPYVDANHAVPVQVNRNGVRSIAVGNGSLVEMELMFVPDTADIEVGDMLVTSGLGGRFPQGYPVAEVIRIEHDPGEHFAKIIVQPLAELNRSRHLLLVMNAEQSLGVIGE